MDLLVVDLNVTCNCVAFQSEECGRLYETIVERLASRRFGTETDFDDCEGQSWCLEKTPSSEETGRVLRKLEIPRKSWIATCQSFVLASSSDSVKVGICHTHKAAYPSGENRLVPKPPSKRKKRSSILCFTIARNFFNARFKNQRLFEIVGDCFDPDCLNSGHFLQNKLSPTGITARKAVCLEMYKNQKGICKLLEITMKTAANGWTDPRIFHRHTNFVIAPLYQTEPNKSKSQLIVSDMVDQSLSSCRIPQKSFNSPPPFMLPSTCPVSMSLSDYISKRLSERIGPQKFAARYVRSSSHNVVPARSKSNIMESPSKSKEGIDVKASESESLFPHASKSFIIPSVPPNSPSPSLSDYTSRTAVAESSSQFSLHSNMSFIVPIPPPNSPVPSLTDYTSQTTMNLAQNSPPFIPTFASFVTVTVPPNTPESSTSISGLHKAVSETHQAEPEPVVLPVNLGFPIPKDSLQITNIRLSRKRRLSDTRLSSRDNVILKESVSASTITSGHHSSERMSSDVLLLQSRRSETLIPATSAGVSSAPQYSDKAELMSPQGVFNPTKSEYFSATDCTTTDKAALDLRQTQTSQQGHDTSLPGIGDDEQDTEAAKEESSKNATEDKGNTVRESSLDEIESKIGK